MAKKVIKNSDGTETDQQIYSYKSLGFGRDGTGLNPVTFNPLTSNSYVTAHFPARQSTPVILDKLSFGGAGNTDISIGGTIKVTVTDYDGIGTPYTILVSLAPCYTTLQSDGVTYNPITPSDAQPSVTAITLSCPLTFSGGDETLTGFIGLSGVPNAAYLKCPLAVGFYTSIPFGTNTVITIDDFTLHV